ncbi:MAG TPA: hypothetical protein VGS41_10035, partial [Chthonomonadales bacterium]|nr:hypothetical protein [Chthonomonadales bacterium]
FNSGYFPIAVWLQDPAEAPKYKDAGFNLYVGLWQGPTERQLATLKAAGMKVFCEQNAVGLAHRTDPDSPIVGWMHNDEPDNAQPVTDPATGKQSYGPCVPPEKIVAEYRAMQRADPTRPIMLNLGQGVANDDWIGRGNGARLSDYATYVKGADIVSFDVYPVAGLGPDGADLLWYVPKGVDRLRNWCAAGQRVWNCIECTNIGGEGKATPAQVRAEVWMSIVHGSRGLIYFVHQFKPNFDEHALLDDPAMLAAVTGINRQISALAPVINSPDVQTMRFAQGQPAIDAVVKRWRRATYLFAVAMRNRPASAHFQIGGIAPVEAAQVIGERRSVPVRNGAFQDTFAAYGVHLYRIAPALR